MIERLHRHVHSQLSKYITSIRQRQVFLSLENGFSSFIEKKEENKRFPLFHQLVLLILQAILLSLTTNPQSAHRLHPLPLEA